MSSILERQSTTFTNSLLLLIISILINSLWSKLNNNANSIIIDSYFIFISAMLVIISLNRLVGTLDINMCDTCRSNFMYFLSSSNSLLNHSFSFVIASCKTLKSIFITAIKSNFCISATCTVLLIFVKCRNSKLCDISELIKLRYSKSVFN
eukprot:NODE_9_length_47730_cov_0.323718.p24 type:complete len:151 gc:universal NODE_9_length_47730_cov_0.323718:9702-9250(-)